MLDCPMLRPAEAAEALGLSLARLRRFAADGRLVTVRTLGGHRRYRQDDVLAVQRWMQRMRTGTMTGATGVSPVHCRQSSPAGQPAQLAGAATPLTSPSPAPSLRRPRFAPPARVEVNRLWAAG